MTEPHFAIAVGLALIIAVCFGIVVRSNQGKRCLFDQEREMRRREHKARQAISDIAQAGVTSARKRPTVIVRGVRIRLDETVH